MTLGATESLPCLECPLETLAEIRPAFNESVQISAKSGLPSVYGASATERGSRRL